MENVTSLTVSKDALERLKIQLERLEKGIQPFEMPPSSTALANTCLSRLDAARYPPTPSFFLSTRLLYSTTSLSHVSHCDPPPVLI